MNIQVYQTAFGPLIRLSVFNLVSYDFIYDSGGSPSLQQTEVANDAAVLCSSVLCLKCVTPA